jgi:hypothetical protein
MGKLMKINLNWLQLNSGFGVPLMESNDPLTFLDSNWLLHSSTLLVKINAKLRIDNIWVSNAVATERPLTDGYIQQAELPEECSSEVELLADVLPSEHCGGHMHGRWQDSTTVLSD